MLNLVIFKIICLPNESSHSSCFCCRHTQDEISISVCEVTDSCESGIKDDTWCMPKCCALDEVFLFWEEQCVRLNGANGVTPWVPPVYDGIKRPTKKLSRSIVSRKIMFQLQRLPKNCAFHSFKNDEAKYVLTYDTPVDVPSHFENLSEWQRKTDLKLSIPASSGNGRIYPLGFNLRQREWVKPNNEYCIDGFYNAMPGKPSLYSGSENQYIVVYCTDPEVDTRKLTAIYLCVFGIALIFLMLTLVVYVMLWSEHDLNGLLVLSYTIATTGDYVFTCNTAFINLFPETLGHLVGLESGGLVCYLNGKPQHFPTMASVTTCGITTSS